MQRNYECVLCRAHTWVTKRCLQYRVQGVGHITDCAASAEATLAKWRHSQNNAAKNVRYAQQILALRRDLSANRERDCGVTKTSLTTSVHLRHAVKSPRLKRSDRVLAIWRLPRTNWSISSMRRNASVSWIPEVYKCGTMHWIVQQVSL